MSEPRKISGNPLSEHQKEIATRAMRDAFYGNPTSEHNWENCKDYWRPVFELLERRLAEHGMLVITTVQ